MKVCIHCRSEKPKSEFNKDSQKKDGLDPRCKKCFSLAKKKWRDANLEKSRLYVRKCDAKNKHKRSVYQKSWYENNKSEILKKNKEWKAGYRKTKKGVCDYFIRNSIRRVLESGSASKYAKEIGYSRDDLIKHIESQFKEGMSWENRSEWHIDHIKPISAFLNEGIDDISVINSLSNLQLLWAQDNIKKGASYVTS
jgi:hypothetical protein